MGAFDDRLVELGIELPPPMPPAGIYVPCTRSGGLLYVGGHGPVAGDLIVRGKVEIELIAELA